MDKYETEPTWKHIWQPLAAFTYLTICVFDFLIMPAIYEIRRPNPEIAINLSMKFTTTASQLAAFQSLQAERNWDPLTNKGGAMFHISFGAILGAASLVRRERKVTNTNNS